ncbi:2OG-Fe(II) oxygenase family protein [Ceratobasidium sp. AG-Ba]|nr:2OG-Fe(II) oxygenase family protein [Ceratobasidium sp. AG-Ba]QRW08703.1 2OG-Fe(II) oxygenase family protein [Ceratobasidium sp. AG-Ba]QRW08712.1 2OG-Fe(II) oxygenase family protein [Ceratobasidium sp. AG-Ba]
MPPAKVHLAKQPVAAPSSKVPLAKRPAEEYMMCDRLTPDPLDRQSQFKKMPIPDDGILKGWDQEMRKLFAEMLTNAVDLPGYSFTEHHAKAKACGFDLDHPDWPTPRSGETITPLLTRPYYLRGKSNECGVWVFPALLAKASLANLNDSTARLGSFDFAPKKKRANAKPKPEGNAGNKKKSAKSKLKGNAGKSSKAGKSSGQDAQGSSGNQEENVDDPNTPAGQHILKRHKFDIDRADLGPCGVRHYVRAWHATGMEFYKSLEPSRDLLRNTSNLELSRRLVMLSECLHLDVRVMALIAIGFPELHHLMSEAGRRLKDYVAVDMLSSVWHNDFFGRAIVYNRQTGVHLDAKGVHGGMDVLVAGGDFKGGELWLHDMNAKIPFLPGTLIAFDGTAQRHSIMPFEGTLRYSHVYFLHQSVFDELGLDTHLPTLTTESMAASLKAAQPRGPPTRVRRQHRQSKPVSHPTRQQSSHESQPVDRLPHHLPNKRPRLN